MKKQKTQSVLQVLTQKIWGKNKAVRNLSTDRLDESGAEKLDPVPFAIAMGIPQTKTIDDRIRDIMRASFLKANPDHGLDSEDPDDFGEDDSLSTDPMYEFERRHERISALQADLDAANEDLSKAKADYQKRRKEAASAPKPQPEGDKGGTPPASGPDEDND